MYESYNVFVDNSEDSIQNINSIIEKVVGHKFEFFNINKETTYKIFYDGIFIDSYEDHGLVNDMNIEFEKFPMKISFGSYGGRTDTDKPRWDICFELAISSAKAISSTIKCECMVTKNVELLIEYHAASD